MIGSGLKKLAQENGMKVAKGVAYGSLHGYAATLSEGSGYKQITITTKFTDTVKLNALQAQLNARDISRELRVRNLTLAPNGINIVFNDTIGTMKKIQEFIDWFFPLLDESSATKADVCTECGMPITGGGCWTLIEGTAFHLHESCAQRIRASVSAEEQAKKDADTGSYVTGLLGALGGAAIGAVVWAIVLSMGYVASLVGLLIGWLADKGYDLLRGKQGKAKIAILIVAVIFGVVAGTLSADVIALVQMINDGELAMAYGDIPMLMMIMLEDPEYSGAVLGNIGQGLLFAALGVFALLAQANKAVSGTKIETLE